MDVWQTISRTAFLALSALAMGCGGSSDGTGVIDDDVPCANSRFLSAAGTQDCSLDFVNLAGEWCQVEHILSTDCSGEVAATIKGAVIANAEIGPDGSFVLALPDDVRGKVRVHSDVPDAAPIDNVTADEPIEVSLFVNRSSSC